MGDNAQRVSAARTGDVSEQRGDTVHLRPVGLHVVGAKALLALAQRGVVKSAALIPSVEKDDADIGLARGLDDSRIVVKISKFGRVGRRGWDDGR